MKTVSQNFGQKGEDFVARYLLERGWKILARNWRPRQIGVRGEIDIVAGDPGGALVAVEVKTRRDSATVYEAISQAKIRKIRALLWVYGQSIEIEKSKRFSRCRIDACLLEVNPSGLKLHHLKNIS